MLLVLATSGTCGGLVVGVGVVIGRSFCSSSTSDSMELFAKYVTDISIYPVFQTILYAYSKKVALLAH